MAVRERPFLEPPVPGRAYVESPAPLVFPVEAKVPESLWHLRLRVLLLELLDQALGQAGLVASDQFLYWDPTDPGACCAPDAMVRLDAAPELIESWKIWERGAPHLAVEIVSRSDAPEPSWAEKLERYRRVGLRELVRFDGRSEERPLRVWDCVEGALAERALPSPGVAQSSVLGLHFRVMPDQQLGRVLRLARDAEGRDLILTKAEAAEARVRELEAELARRR